MAGDERVTVDVGIAKYKTILSAFCLTSNNFYNVRLNEEALDTCS